MNPSFTGPLPKPAYLRLLEYQRQRMALPAYAVDLPLLLFILFSRIAAGLSILSFFFLPPFFGWVPLSFVWSWQRLLPLPISLSLPVFSP